MNRMPSGKFTRKVIGGLVVVLGLGLVIAALSSSTNLLAFLPFLLILACPLMMIFMMGSMGHNPMAAAERQPDTASEDLPYLARLPRDQQVRELRGELTRIAWRQEALRHTLEQVEAEQQAAQGMDTENAAGTR